MIEGPYTGYRDEIKYPSVPPEEFVSQEIVFHKRRDELTKLLEDEVKSDAWKDTIYNFISELPSEIGNKEVLQQWREQYSR